VTHNVHPAHPRPYRHLKIRTREHLAQRVGVPLPVLEEVARFVDLHYNPTWVKQKKDGSGREIDAPKPLLKHIQKQIHAKLLVRIWLPDPIHGYRRRRSIMTATEMHVGARHLWVADVQSFYPSISAWHVRQMFVRLKCTPDVAGLLTRLTTRNHCLPQGTPTSPILANLYLRIYRVAERIEGLAKEYGLQVSFFGDDIVVSGPRPFSHLHDRFEKIIQEAGLRLKKNKIMVASAATETHRALGIVLNARGSERDVPRGYRRQLRQLLYIARRHGLGAFRARGLTTADPRSFLNGKISFAASVNKRNRVHFEALEHLR
jgi:RNA-directed DNA polymerase